MIFFLFPNYVHMHLNANSASVVKIVGTWKPYSGYFIALVVSSLILLSCSCSLG